MGKESITFRNQKTFETENISLGLSKQLPITISFQWQKSSTRKHTISCLVCFKRLISKWRFKGCVVGSKEAPSKAFSLFFLLPDHLKVEWNVVFQTLFRAIFVPP